MLIKLYHGTSKNCLQNIKKDGLLKATYLTSDVEQAQYYAECASDEDSSEPCIIVATVNTDKLAADLPSFNEPLSFILDTNDLTEDEWHEAIHDGELPYPELSDWRTSLKITSSVYHREPILAKNIIFDNAIICDEDVIKIKKAIENENTINTRPHIY